MITYSKNIRAPQLLALMVISILFISCGDDVTQPPITPGQGPVLLVANDGGGAGYLSTIAIDSGTVQRGVIGLGRLPNTILRKDNMVYVLNSGSQDINVMAISDSNVVTPMDTVDVSFGGNRAPQYMTLAETGDFYISNFADNSVSVVNSVDLTNALLIPNVGQGPQGILAYNDKVYVCISGYRNGSYDNPGIVAVISTVSNRVVNRIDVGVNPQFLIKDETNQIHVVCTGNYSDIAGKVNIISAFADTITYEINIGGQPGDIAISGRYAYLTNWGDGTDGFLYRYDIFNHGILNGPNDPIRISSGAQRIVAGVSNNVYVSCFAADRVDEVAGENRLNSWSIGDGPSPMLFLDR